MGGPHAAVPDSRDSLTRAGLSIFNNGSVPPRSCTGGRFYTAGSRSLGPLPELTADLVASSSREGTDAVDSGFTCNCTHVLDGQSGCCGKEGSARYRQ